MITRIIDAIGGGKGWTMPSKNQTRRRNYRVSIVGVAAALGISVFPLASSTVAGATTASGTGLYTCSAVGTVTFSPPWKAGSTGKVTATVSFTGPGFPLPARCAAANTAGVSPVPTSVIVAGQVTFTNGTCSPGVKNAFIANTLTVTYPAAVAPSTFTFGVQSGINLIYGANNKGGFGGFGTVTGSYATAPGAKADLGDAGGAQVTGSCATGITQFSWGQSTGNYVALGGF